MKWKCNSKCNSNLLFSKEKISVMYAYLFQTIPVNINQWFWSLWAAQKIQDLCNICLQIVLKPRNNSEVKKLVLMARFYTQFTDETFATVSVTGKTAKFIGLEEENFRMKIYICLWLQTLIPQTVFAILKPRLFNVSCSDSKEIGMQHLNYTFLLAAFQNKLQSWLKPRASRGMPQIFPTMSPKYIPEGKKHYSLLPESWKPSREGIEKWKSNSKEQSVSWLTWSSMSKEMPFLISFMHIWSARS